MNFDWHSSHSFDANRITEQQQNEEEVKIRLTEKEAKNEKK